MLRLAYGNILGTSALNSTQGRPLKDQTDGVLHFRPGRIANWFELRKSARLLDCGAFCENTSHSKVETFPSYGVSLSSLIGQFAQVDLPE